MKIHAWVLALAACGLCSLPDTGLSADETAKPRTLPPIPLSLNEVHAWIDRSHPLLKGAGTEKLQRAGKCSKPWAPSSPSS